MQSSRSEHHIELNSPFGIIACAEAFKKLSADERRYAHHLSRASWNGALTCLFQCSPESPLIFLLFQRLFRYDSLEALKKIALEQCRFSEENWDELMIYVSAFYDNMGNYKSFGDSKFVPNLTADQLGMLVRKSSYAKNDSSCTNLAISKKTQKLIGVELYDSIKEAMFSLSKTRLVFGFPPAHLTTYFSGNCTEKDGKAAQQFLDAKKLSAYNTRLFRETSGQLTVKVASASHGDTGSRYSAFLNELVSNGPYTIECDGETFKFAVELGDHGPFMQMAVDSLSAAKTFAANDTEREMIDLYMESFRSGSIEAHKDASRLWVKDKGPAVESYIGFIESYRDPHGSRGEWEGFVAVVNRIQSEKFGTLVNQAEKFISKLPWPESFEKDTFLRPDFTSLDIVAFGSSGAPIGINIPNYDDIRQTEGFKNVSLDNVMTANLGSRPVLFLDTDDAALMTKYRMVTLEICVALHELLGHGTGKLFQRQKDGSLNFNADTTINPLTGKPIASYYGVDDTWDTKFTSLSSPYEECRAESVALFLCVEREVMEIFGFKDAAVQDDLVYVGWMQMCLSGLRSLQMYQPQQGKWGQAHCHARFTILCVLMEGDQDAGDDAFLRIDQITNETDGKKDLRLRLNRKKIQTTGLSRMADFLTKLQVYKSTADYEAGRQLFDKYSLITDQWLAIRNVVMDRRHPRPILLQGNTKLTADGLDAEFIEYGTNAAGMVESFQDRFGKLISDDDRDRIETSIVDLSCKQQPYFDGFWP